MNTLLCDVDGNVYDPTGEGLADLESGRVRFVGDPAQRIAEDYLRILRFFRFYACYGQGEPDSEALAACKAAADKIDTLSRERITQEFFKIIMAENAVPVMDLMFGQGVLKDLPVAGYDLSLFVPELSLAARLFVLAGLKAVEIDRMEKWLIFSNAQKREIKAIAKAFHEAKVIDEKTAKVLIYRYGHDIAAQVFSLRHYGGSTLKNWDVPVFPLNGEDVKAAGIAQGEEVGRALRAIEDWWIEQDFKPDRSACLGKLP